jgi:hypothetical protein
MLKTLENNISHSLSTGMAIVAFAVLALLVPSCTKETNDAHSSVTTSDFTGTIWRLQSISTSDTNAPLPQQTLLDRDWLLFHPDGTVEGFGEYHAIVGTYTLSDDKIALSFAQPDSARLSQDVFCLYALSANRVATSDDRLTLSAPDGYVMDFVAVEDDILENRWRWVETRAGIDGMGGTPQSAGLEAVVAFGDTTFVFYKDEQEVARGSYRLQNTRVSDCIGETSGMARAITIDMDVSNLISVATNALVTIPCPSIITYEILPDGRILLSLRENTCAGYLYIFEKM